MAFGWTFLLGAAFWSGLFVHHRFDTVVVISFNVQTYSVPHGSLAMDGATFLRTRSKKEVKTVMSHE